jgi:hypothetical protein
MILDVKMPSRSQVTMSTLLCAFVFAACASIVSAADVDFASQHPGSLLITLSTDKMSYDLGSAILVTIKKTNISGVPLQTNVLDNTIDYDMVVKHGEVEMQPYPLALRNSRVVEAPLRPYRLGPGATVTDPGTEGTSSPLTDWGLKITEPGTYVLTAISRETKQKSNPVTITVTP